MLLNILRMHKAAKKGQTRMYVMQYGGCSCSAQVRWHGGFNASAMAAARAKSSCHELRERQRQAGDYDLDYGSEGLGEAEDPCEEAVKQAREVALLAAAEKGEAKAVEKAEAGQQQAPGGPASGDRLTGQLY